MPGVSGERPAHVLDEPELTNLSADDVLAQARELLAAQRAEIERLRHGMAEPVAVLGMGFRLPGGVESPDELWAFLHAGGDAVAPMTGDRWDADGTSDTGTTPESALVEGHDLFDPAYFRLSPREAESMDPQQRMLLEVTDRAFQDAGVALSAGRVGMFVSTSSDDYLLQSADLDRRELFTSYTGTGTARAVSAGRLGHVFGFTGPALHVDTACSSSLVALHLATRSLRDGECDLAVVAAANLIAAPQNLLLRGALDALARSGRCRAFAADADGFVPGEGAVAVLLQPLGSALAAGRRPLALIRGSAINHNGRGAGLTVPSGRAQHEVVAEALRRAGVRADEIDLVEAHGTGTRLGDPIEVAALAEAYRGARRIDLGSVKTNFGHLEAAAGLLSLAKVVLCLEHGELVPTLHARTLNPAVDWAAIPFSVTTDPKTWSHGRRPRRAGISSFGMAGTNAHLIVEEPPEPAPIQRGHPPRALLLSARTEPALRGLARAYGDLLDKVDPDAFGDVCASAAIGRDHHRHRLAVVVDGREAAIGALRAWADGEHPDGVLAVDSATKPGFVEVNGPRETVAPFGSAVRPTGPNAPLLVDGDTVRSTDTGVDGLLGRLDDCAEALGVALYLHGADVDLSTVYAPGTFQPVRLPHHPFNRRRLWIPQPTHTVRTTPEKVLVNEGNPPMPVAATAVPSAPSAEPAAVIAEWVAELLGMTVDEVEVNQPLLELGADSLVFVELVGRVDAHFGVELVLRQLFEELLTVRALGDYIAERIPAKPAAAGLDQDGYASALNEEYTRKTAASIAQYREFLPVMCNNRRGSSDVRPETAALSAPLRVVSSRSAQITDVDGNDYVDIAMGFGVNLFGHQAPFIVEALRAQLDLGMQLGPESATAGEVARLLTRLTGTERVLFCNSGTEAVMTMMRLARAHVPRRKIVVFRNSYHGHFDSTLVNATAVRDSTAVPSAIGVPAGLVEDVIVLPFADQRALDEISARSAEIAAVLVEPVQNRRPDLHPGSFLRDLRVLTEQAGILLAFDEILTGFRIHPGGAAAHFGIRPDLVSYAKIIGGGMPLGVVAGRADVMDHVDGGAGPVRASTTYTAGTYCRHPLAMAAALAVLRKFESDGGRLQQRLNARTDEMRDRLNRRFAELDIPLAVYNFGSFFRFAVNGNLSFVHQPLEMDYFTAAMLTKGVYIAEGGTCFLSTAHTDDDVDRVVTAATDSARELREAGFFATHAPMPPAPAKEPSAPAPLPLAPSVPAIRAPAAAAQVTARPSAESAVHRGSVREAAVELSLSFFGDYPAEADSTKYDVVRSAARTADGHLGAVWVPERHFHSFGGLSPNPSVLGAFLAAATTSIQIRAGSVVLPLHDPIRVAEEWSMVDNMSGGRVGLAFASGWQRNDFVLARTAFADRREVMWSGVETVRQLWRGERVTATSDGIEVDVSLHPRPLRPELPVWIAALSSPETFRRAGALGLSVLTNLVGQTHDQLRANIEVYRQARRDAGFDGPGHVTALLHTLVTADAAEVETARGPLRRYLGSSVDLLTAVVDSDQHTAFERLSERDREYLFDRSVDRYLRDNTMIGDPEFCVDVAGRIARLGVDEIACFVDFGVPATELLAGVDRLLALNRRLRQDPGRTETTPVHLGPPATSRASADLVGSISAEDVVRAVEDAPAARSLVDRLGTPPAHVVDLRMLGDLEQEEQASEFFELDEESAEPWSLTLVMCGGGRVRIVVSAEGGSAQAVLDDVVLALGASEPDGPVTVPARGNEQIMRLACEADLATAPAYQVRTTLRLDGDLDIDALQRAVHRVSDRHQALRTTWSDDGETLTVHPSLAPRVHVVDLSALGESDLEAELDQWYVDEAEELIDLAEGPPWRITVLRIAERTHRLVITAHHVVYDGWSERIVVADLATAYAAETLGRSPDWAPSVDYLAWRDADAGYDDATAAEDRRFWRDQVAGAAESTAEAQLTGGRGGRIRRTLSADTTAALRAVAAAATCTPYVALLSCYAMTLRRIQGATAITVGVSVDRRDAEARQGLVGYFANLLPLRISAEASSPAEMLPVTRDAMLAVWEHQRLPFAEIVALAAATNAGGKPAPVVPTCFNWDHVVVPDFGATSATLVPDEGVFVRFDLSLNVLDTDDGALTLEWDYSLRAYDDDGIAEVADLFDAVVAELVGAKVSDGDTLVSRFEAVARRSPLRIAIHDGSEEVTFDDLRRRAARVAAGLAERGVRQGMVVTVAGPNSISTSVAVLGVLMAGAAFSVLPTSTPDRALEAYVAACDSRLVVWSGPPRSVAADSVRLSELDADPAERPATRAAGTDPAYLIMTSGSTGVSKPVVVEHRAILEYLDAFDQHIPVEGRTCLSVTSLAHDLGYTAVWSALTRGGTLVLADEEVASDPGLLADLCERVPIDLLKITPTHLEAMLDSDGAAVLPTRDLVLGGETLTWTLVEQVRKLDPELTVWNHYGPSEAVVGVIMYRVSDPDPWRERPTVPIGTPLGGRVRVDGDELLVAGGLARGYLNMPDETAAAFPWLDEPDGTRTRWYRTGDLVAQLEDGTLEFLGRRDDQVSLRGHRIELGAVEAALGAVPGVKAVAACVCGTGTDARLLAGAVVADGVQPRDVLAAVAKTLPAHEVPSSLVALPRLPRTASGKLDRGALAESLGSARPAGGATEPHGGSDDRIAEMTAIWRDILELDEVAADDDFFDLGGHSIHAIKIVARARAVFGRRVPIKALFDGSTPRGLLTLVTRPVS